MPDKLYLRRQLGATVESVLLRLEVEGVLIPDDLRGYKAAPRRDKREPGRREKEEAEDALMLFMMRRFRRQARILKERLAMVVKAVPFPLDDIFEPDSEEVAELIRLLMMNTRNGVTLFMQATGVGIDYSLTNVQAAEWARRYAGELIKGIDATTLDTVRRAVEMFVDTPGFTIGDVMGMLPFDEQRALRIATTEITRSYAQGQLIAGEEMRAQFPEVKVKKQWFTNADSLVCEMCGPLNGMEVDFDTEFYSVDSIYQDGNPPRHVNCILPGNEVVCPDLIAAAKSFYDGRCIELTLSNGRRLTVTENHPILTMSGWIAAKLLRPFDYVLCALDSQRIVSTINPYNQNMPTLVQEVWGALKESDFMLSSRMPISPKDFYGDGRFIDGNIDIVYPNSILLNNLQSRFTKPISQNILNEHCSDLTQLARESSPLQFQLISLPIFRGDMSGVNLGGSLFRSHRSPLESFALGLVARTNSSIKQTLSEGPSIDTSLAREFILRFSGDITEEQIVNIRDFNFSGHVYDLQSSMYQLYITNGIIVKNCRCWMTTYTALADLTPQLDYSPTSIPDAMQAQMNHPMYNLDKQERVFIYDDNGNVLFDKWGDKDGVDFKLDDRFKNGQLLHNHPPERMGPTIWDTDTLTFSKSDIELAYKQDLSRIVATGQKETFMMERPLNGWGDFDKSYLQTVKNLATNKEYADIVTNYRYELANIPMSEKNEMSKKLWREFAKVTNAIYKEIRK